MASQRVFLITCLLATLGHVILAVSANVVNPIPNPFPKPIPKYHLDFNRSSFPSGFVFGAGSAAYQSEGGAYIDGKGLSIWDTFTKEHPEKIADQSNGNITDDFYHRFRGDILLMKKIGLDSFRFSISWSRVLPKGKISGGINLLGVKFYNDLINALLANGITPFVTLFHWDVPQALEDEYNGFLSSKIVDDYRDYVDFCFKTFGDRVKHWCTLNEPFTFSYNGYNYGAIAPGRCSSYMGNCTAGNSATEPYIVAHNLLLSHAAGVQLYREKYQKYQKGVIGVTLVTNWFKPKDSSSVTDQKAADRELDFFFGWFAHPIVYGDYPETMKDYVGNRLPKFTESQSQLLKGSLDFLGVNYYTSNYVTNNPLKTTVNQSYSSDSQTVLSVAINGVPIGTPTALSWLYVVPEGIYDLMLYIRDRYKNPPIYITENGIATLNNASLTLEQNLKDGTRIKYHYSHLKYLLQAITEGANVKGYYVWSFFDDFEWDAGFTVRFGLVYVNYTTLTRHLKYSAYWLKRFLLR